jgi:hypothetical protein
VIRTHYSLEIRLFMFHDQEAVAIATKPLAKILRKGESSAFPETDLPAPHNNKQLKKQRRERIWLVFVHGHE